VIAYLSGAMEFAKGEGASWREEMTLWLDEKLGHSVIDPVVENIKLKKDLNAEDYRSWKIKDRGKYIDYIRHAVDFDLDAVTKKADYIICLWDEAVFKGAGTHGEVTMAYYLGKPIYLINRVDLDDLSGWIEACSTELFDDFELLKSRLVEIYLHE
jgi:hypothetical protein